MNVSAFKRLVLALVAASAAAGAHPQEALRPEVGKPLQAAQELIKAQKFKEALAKVREADAVAAKSPHESNLVERMRISAALGAGDAEAAAKSFEALKDGDKLPAADRVRILESLSIAFYRAKDMARAGAWARRYFAEGGSNPQVRALWIQAMYLGGDPAGAAHELAAECKADEQAGRVPPQERLMLWLDAARQAGDNAAYLQALERLAAHYSKKEHWAELLARVQRKPGFSDRLALDVYRLMLASGSMRGAGDYMEMAQLAVQAGLAGEGRQVLEKGFAAGVLGVGLAADIDRQRRLKELVARRMQEEQQELPARQARAKDSKSGAELVDLGLSQAYLGSSRTGLAAMEQGIARGGLKRPDDARLHLGVAWLAAGEPARAQAVFRSVGGSDGTADLARLWELLLSRRP